VGHTPAKQGASVFWEIGDNSGVSEIRIEPKKGAENIWIQRPRMHGMDGGWMGVVNPHARVGAEYDYSIIWRGTGGTGPHPYDPKISVMPAALHKDLITPILLLSLGLVGLSCLFFLNKRRKERIRNKQQPFER
jgi:hypothetical protein